ncbi:MAG: RHS repeat-associated core domain-containing protein [Phycisphaerales bacterium]|nr:RHS repeat-associated core domain-containing protein [Phycisphaerales bacterium]
MTTPTDVLRRVSGVVEVYVEIIPPPAAVLEISYVYDARGLIDWVTENGIDGSATIDYVYDRRGRLTRETRSGASAYDLAYTYDAGGNRETKVDALNGRQTTYHYDLNNNRLELYTVMATSGAQNGYTLERVEYEFENSGDAAGNVRRVVRKAPDPPGPVPDEWFVYATEFFYNKAGEVQVISQRQWHEAQGVVNPLTLMTTAIREFRGNGRTRYMMRDRIADEQASNYLMPDYDTGTWTSYDGETPTKDLTLTWTTTPAPAHYVGSNVVRYHLGLAQFTPDPATPELNDYAVKYFHADHLGTTRAMTDEGQPGPPIVAPTALPRIVYTAFGEKMSTIGTAETRYQYVGQHGYETFPNLPYQHVGHRWYDPSTGRFLQRDPIGINGGYNVFAYIANAPLDGVDPSGLYIEHDTYRNPDGSYTHHYYDRGWFGWDHEYMGSVKGTMPVLPDPRTFDQRFFSVCAATAIGGGVGAYKGAVWGAATGAGAAGAGAGPGAIVGGIFGAAVGGMGGFATGVLREVFVFGF